MPLMYSRMGWLLATCILALAAVLGAFTATLMAHVGVAEHTESYHMSIKTTLGAKWKLVYQGLVIFGVFGGLVSAQRVLVDSVSIMILSFCTISLCSSSYHLETRVLELIIEPTGISILEKIVCAKKTGAWNAGHMSPPGRSRWSDLRTAATVL